MFRQNNPTTNLYNASDNNDIQDTNIKTPMINLGVMFWSVIFLLVIMVLVIIIVIRSKNKDQSKNPEKLSNLNQSSQSSNNQQQTQSSSTPIVLEPTIKFKQPSSIDSNTDSTITPQSQVVDSNQNLPANQNLLPESLNQEHSSKQQQSSTEQSSMEQLPEEIVKPPVHEQDKPVNYEEKNEKNDRIARINKDTLAEKTGNNGILSGIFSMLRKPKTAFIEQQIIDEIDNSDATNEQQQNKTADDYFNINAAYYWLQINPNTLPTSRAPKTYENTKNDFGARYIHTSVSDIEMGMSEYEDFIENPTTFKKLVECGFDLSWVIVDLMTENQNGAAQNIEQNTKLLMRYFNILEDIIMRIMIKIHFNVEETNPNDLQQPKEMKFDTNSTNWYIWAVRFTNLCSHYIIINKALDQEDKKIIFGIPAYNKKNEYAGNRRFELLRSQLCIVIARFIRVMLPDITQKIFGAKRTKTQINLMLGPWCLGHYILSTALELVKTESYNKARRSILFTPEDDTTKDGIRRDMGYFDHGSATFYHLYIQSRWEHRWVLNFIVMPPAHKSVIASSMWQYISCRLFHREIKYGNVGLMGRLDTLQCDTLSPDLWDREKMLTVIPSTRTMKYKTPVSEFSINLQLKSKPAYEAVRSIDNMGEYWVQYRNVHFINTDYSVKFPDNGFIYRKGQTKAFKFPLKNLYTQTFYCKDAFSFVFELHGLAFGYHCYQMPQLLGENVLVEEMIVIDPENFIVQNKIKIANTGKETLEYYNLGRKFEIKSKASSAFVINYSLDSKKSHTYEDQTNSDKVWSIKDSFKILDNNGKDVEISFKFSNKNEDAYCYVNGNPELLCMIETKEYPAEIKKIPETGKEITFKFNGDYLQYYANENFHEIYNLNIPY